MKNILSCRSFKLNNKQIHKQDSCQIMSKKPYPRLASYKDISTYIFDIKELNQWVKIPSIFSQFITFFPIKHFIELYGINSHDDIIFIKSFCTAKYDNEFNFEAFETLGDSILKLITGFFLYACFKDIDEN